MVHHLRSIGLNAAESDVLDLHFPQQFDSAFAMNCLLHVPIEDLPGAFAAVKSTLGPGGLFYLGQYGGIAQDGVLDEDSYVPKRYFSWLTDDAMFDAVRAQFDVVTFDVVDV